MIGCRGGNWPMGTAVDGDTAITPCIPSRCFAIGRYPLLRHAARAPLPRSGTCRCRHADFDLSIFDLSISGVVVRLPMERPGKLTARRSAAC
jgi:hypothetical protein